MPVPVIECVLLERRSDKSHSSPEWVKGALSKRDALFAS
jgi:hypothetical protein